MTRGGYGDSTAEKKQKQNARGVDSLSKRPATFPAESFYAHWEVGDNTYNYQGQGEILDWAGCSFETNHEGLFPSIDGDGVAEVFGGPEVCPVMNYGYKGRDASGWHTHWSLTLGLHYSPIRKGIHWAENSPDNIGAGSSTGFSQFATTPWWVSQSSDVILSGGDTVRYSHGHRNDKAEFGTIDGTLDSTVAQVVRYYRQNYTGEPDGLDQLIKVVRLHAYVIPNDYGIYLA